MPRKPRAIIPGAVYHLISRFVDRRWFIESSVERRMYIDLLGRALTTSDWRCHSYAVMSNHIHLGVTAGEDLLDAWVRRVNSRFADWMNRTHERIGSVFVRGPKDFAVPPAEASRLVAYIHNNPVRAGVVAAPSESTWTSHRAYLGIDLTPSWLDVEGGLRLAGFSTGKAFDDWATSSLARPTNEMLSREQPPSTVIDTRLTRCPRRPRIPACDPALLVQRVATELNITVADLCSPRRGDKHVRGRRVAAQCAEALGMTGAMIATALCISQQSVSAMLRRPDHGADADVVQRVISYVSGPMNDIAGRGLVVTDLNASC